MLFCRIKNIKSIVFLTLFLSLINCKSESNIDNKPSSFIKKEEFVSMIYDISLLEGNLNNFNLNQDVFKDSALSFYKGIFTKYDVSYEDFKKNQEYYILTDQFKEISEKVLERVKIEEEKYKDLKPYTVMSFIQFKQLLETDGLYAYFVNDTISTYQERLDSALSYYRKNPKNFSEVAMDSLSFELNVARLKRGKDLFQGNSIFKKMPVDE